MDIEAANEKGCCFVFFGRRVCCAGNMRCDLRGAVIAQRMVFCAGLGRSLECVQCVQCGGSDPTSLPLSSSMLVFLFFFLLGLSVLVLSIVRCLF